MCKDGNPAPVLRSQRCVGQDEEALVECQHVAYLVGRVDPKRSVLLHVGPVVGRHVAALGAHPQQLLVGVEGHAGHAHLLLLLLVVDTVANHRIVHLKLVLLLRHKL